MSPLPPGSIPLRERRTLADEWRSLEALIFSPRTPDVQRAEMRKAFYAGAAEMLSLLIGGLDPEAGATELDLAYVDSLLEELRAFEAELCRAAGGGDGV